MALLIIEDSPRLAASLSRGLAEDGFTVVAVGGGVAALERLERGDVDAVVLDLGLPDMDGLEVLAHIRGRGLVVPVLVLTARDAVDERVRALDQGADDYLVKPFEYAELLARMRALLRRAAAPRWAPLAAEGLVLQPGDPTIQVDGRPVSLSPREHALLALLLRRRTEVLSRAEILGEVFGYNFDPGTNLVDVHVSNLRRKLRDAAVRIETVRGIGYRLCGNAVIDV